MRIALFLMLVASLTAVAFPAGQADAASGRLPPDASGEYVLDRNHANVFFAVSHLGYSQYMGRFDSIDAKLTLNAADPTKSQLTATITPASVDVNNPELQNILRSEPYFNVVQFPQITFTSRQIQLTGPDTGAVLGDLTMLGVTKPLVLKVKFNRAGINPYASVYTVGFSATAKLSRSDWGMKTLVPQVGDDVSLLIEAEFTRKG